MAKLYKVKHTSIMHNGKLYKEGATIELEDNYAKRLEDFVQLLQKQKLSLKITPRRLKTIPLQIIKQKQVQVQLKPKLKQKP